MDEKRLRGEEEHVISEAEKAVWLRGKDDAKRNKLLQAARTLPLPKAIALVKLYATMGDIHYVTTKFDITVDEAQRVLRAFDINSIEDARQIIRSGIIAEYEAEQAVEADAEEIQRREDHVAAQQRLDERTVEEETPDPEEVDAKLHQRREEAQAKNKRDQLRAILSEGLSADENTSSFRIPLGLVKEFKQLIPHGVSQLQRRFGGSPKDIIKEIKRLAPHVDTTMLRP